MKQTTVELKFVETTFSETTRFPKTTKDFYSIYIGEFGRLYIVARGIGGESAEIVSQLAVITIKGFFDKLPSKYNAQLALYQAFATATKEVLSFIATHSWVSNCSTSVGLLLYCHSGVYIAHAGDCKVLLLRKNKVTSLTSDNMPAPEPAEAPLDDDIPALPVVPSTADLSNVEPEIISNVELYKDDCLLISTKGVYQRVTRPEMVQAFSGDDLLANINLLWDVAKERKSNDDFTLIALKVIKGLPLPLDAKTIEQQKMIFNWLKALFIFCMIALALTLYSII